MTEDLEKLRAAARSYANYTEKAEQARQQVFTLVISALRAGERPTDVAEASPFTAAYVRRIARENGVDPSKKAKTRKR